MMTFGHRFVRRADVRFPWLISESVPRPLVRRHDAVHPFDLRGRMGWKRVKDVSISVLGIVILSPVMLLTAIVVKATSPGPVFYRQERIGINRRRGDRRMHNGELNADRRGRDRRVLVNFGRPFTIYKFRTMVMDAERGAPPMWARENDPRITPVGRVLRKTRVDELPQFWNVLRGDMSIVGPRPERPFFVEQFKHRIPQYMLRHKVKAGITGWAQINGWRGNTSLEKRIEFDLYYIEHWSLSLDFKIMWLTVLRGLNRV